MPSEDVFRPLHYARWDHIHMGHNQVPAHRCFPAQDVVALQSVLALLIGVLGSCIVQKRCQTLLISARTLLNATTSCAVKHPCGAIWL